MLLQSTGAVGAAAAAAVESSTADAEAEMMKAMGFSSFDSTKVNQE